MSARNSDPRPLIAHVIHRLDYGGLENGVVNVINGLPEDAFRHTIIALTQASDFRRRLKRADVEVHALDKQPGKDPGSYLRLFRLLRSLRPAVVHTRNVGTIEAALVSRLAGVRARVHGEHGWDTHDVDGKNRKFRAMRRGANPFIDRFVTVSRELEQWLVDTVGIRSNKVTRICNGVDIERFKPLPQKPRDVLPTSCFSPGTIAVGSVTRFSEIKDPLNLVRAFVLARRQPAGAALRLVMFGDGPLRPQALQLLEEAGESNNAWLPGSRDDVPHLLRELDVFVLGSRREGISNTVLEAMASGLPVVASATGGNLELIEDRVSGFLLPPGDSQAIATVLLDYASNPTLRIEQGAAARRRAEREYSLQRMLADYEALYRSCTYKLGEVA